MRRLAWVLTVVAATWCGCSKKPQSASPRPMPPAELIARLDDLAKHHRIVEALELLESQQAGISGLDPQSPPALALREKQALLYLNVSLTREAAERLAELVRLKPADSRLRALSTPRLSSRLTAFAAVGLVVRRSRVTLPNEPLSSSLELADRASTADH